jgi:hypothetical protein
MNAFAIAATNLSKKFRLGAAPTPAASIRTALSRRFGRRGRPDDDILWALRDVSFEVPPGRGRRHHRPQRRGQEHAAQDPVAHHRAHRGQRDDPRPRRRLLEVGTGFHPELTGRENIFLNGAILGMRARRSRASSTRSSPSPRSSVPRHAGEALLERHVRAARVRRRRAPRAGDPDRRRGARGRRRRSRRSASARWRDVAARGAPCCSSATT